MQALYCNHRWAPNKACLPEDNVMANAFFRNAFNRMIEARERQVSRYVNGAMLSLDDTTLKSLGTSREELRRKGASQYIF
jgi:hypothetical protein